jgi:hypothetical protein
VNDGQTGRDVIDLVAAESKRKNDGRDYGGTIGDQRPNRVSVHQSPERKRCSDYSRIRSWRRFSASRYIFERSAIFDTTELKAMRPQRSMPHLLLSFGKQIDVAEPVMLRRAIAELALELAQY